MSHRVLPQFKWPAIILISALTACGSESSSTKPGFSETLDHIQANGFPSFDALWPALPPSFSFVNGVATSASGLAEVQTFSNGAAISDTTNDFSALLTEARGLSAQGFTEARRIEALVHNFIKPIFGLLGRSDIFVALGTGGSSTQSALSFGSSLTSNSVTNIFAQLAQNLSFAVELPTLEGMPSHLLFSGESGQEFLTVSGLWKQGDGSFVTGFRTDVLLRSLEDFEFTFTFAPSQLGGLVKEWGGQSCAEDLWRVKLTAKDGAKAASVDASECPKARAALSSLTLNLKGDEMVILGSFAENFSGKPGTLRQWLGERQGFVMQAATGKDLQRVAAAAAVLKQDNFQKFSQTAVDEFGVGRLMGRFIQERYWQPLLAKANKDSIFNNYSNVAYWACSAPVVSEGVKAASSYAANLCSGKEIDTDQLLSVLQVLNEELKKTTLVSADIKKSVSTVVDVLAIRNSIFINGTGQLSYKQAPDEIFSGLDKVRTNMGAGTLADQAWYQQALAQLPKLAAADVPGVSFGAVSGQIGAYLGEQCGALVTDAVTKAKKTGASTSKSCQF